MVSIGRKTAAFLAAAGAVVLLAQPIWATASEDGGGRGSGTFTETSFLAPPTVTPTADGTTLVSQTTTGTFSGTIDGTFTEVFIVAIFADGTLSFSGLDTCVCAVAGHSGIFEDRIAGTGTFPNFAGTLTVLRGTGNLQNLRATAKFTGTVGSNHLASGNYTIRYRFHSDS
jgi:hypothetical protein